MKNKKQLLTLCLSFFCVFSHAQDCTLDPNKRTQVTGTDVANEYSCFMEMTRGWSTYYGTGALIHPRVVITAGHNIAYFPFVKRLPFFLFSGTRKVDLFFGSKSQSNYTAAISVKLKKNKTKFFNDSYWTNSAIRRDFAIIILPDSSVYKKVGGCYKFLPVDTTELINHFIHITGSPGDKALYSMWTDSTNNFTTSGGYIRYDLFTEVRNSGSPIWMSPRTPQLVGVHSRSYGNCNASVFVDKATYDKVVEWCRQVGIDL